jgi:hypothetical protein
MKPGLHPLETFITEQSRATLKRVATVKGITAESAGSVMVNFCCRLMEEGALQKGTELIADLDFAKAYRVQTIRRADQILGVAEKVLLESQGLQRGLRNRAFGE